MLRTSKESLTKRTQNKWGSKICEFFYELYEYYKELENVAQNPNIPAMDKEAYRVLAWNLAWSTADMFYNAKKRSEVIV